MSTSVQEGEKRKRLRKLTEEYIPTVEPTAPHTTTYFWESPPNKAKTACIPLPTQTPNVENCPLMSTREMCETQSKGSVN